jgi:hypothetical protein
MEGVDFGVFLVPEGNPYETLKSRALRVQVGSELYRLLLPEALNLLGGKPR